DPARESGVLAAKHRRTLADADRRDILEQQLRPLFRHEGQLAQTLQRVTDLAWIADVDRVALASLNDLAGVVAADGGRDDGLDVGDRKAEARRGGAIDVDVDVAATGQPFRQGRRHAGNVPDRR